MSDSYPRPEPSASGSRNPIGWLVLGFLLLFAVFNLVAGFGGREDARKEAKALDGLRNALVLREMGRKFGAPDVGLRKLEEQVAPQRGKDAEAAALWFALRTELKEPTKPADLKPALLSKRIDLKAIAEAYADRPVDRGTVQAKLRVLDGRGPLSHLAATHLREAAGLPGARTWIETATKRYLALLVIVGVVGFGSLLAWGALLIAAANGTLPNLGPPQIAHSLADADRLAIRAATLMASFQAVSLLFGVLGGPTWIKTAGIGLSMFAVVPIILRARPSFEEAVGARGYFGRKVLLGLWAFGLEIPVTYTVAIVGSAIFRNLPQNEHPAARTLMTTHDPVTIVSLFFLGAVLAPFWEEIMFRGLLFPAIRRVLNSPLWGALLSSFVFASVHPQGPGGWLGLIAFAVCSCVLVSRTRSLVPSIVMHAAHNGTLLTLALLMGG